MLLYSADAILCRSIWGSVSASTSDPRAEHLPRRPVDGAVDALQFDDIPVMARPPSLWTSGLHDSWGKATASFPEPDTHSSCCASGLASLAQR